MLNCSVPFKSAGTVAFIISPFSGESSGFKSIVLGYSVFQQLNLLWSIDAVAGKIQKTDIECS